MLNLYRDPTFLNAIDAIKANIYWKDLAGKYLVCNQHMLDVFVLNRRDDVIGKTDFDLCKFDEAKTFQMNDQIAIEKGSYEGEEIFTCAEAGVITVMTVKNRLCDSEGNMIGLVGTSLDITAQKEAERLKRERALHEVRVHENEKLIKVARKVAHDINSPLTALKMIMPACGALPEEARTILNQAICSIADIANNLFSTYKKVESQSGHGTEPRQPLLISDLLVQLLSQKRVEYSSHAVKFETAIDLDAHFAFALMQHGQFSRSISNLINNAVDAVDGKRNGIIQIGLSAYSEVIMVTIQDNGKGMSPDLLEKMLNRVCFTYGKDNGQETSLQQVWNTVDNNEGILTVDSAEGVGTSVHIAFPRIKAADWLSQTIRPAVNSIVVILDDDESIHGAWDIRFNPLLGLYPDLQLHHFSNGQQTLHFFDSLSPADSKRVLFLSDYELIGQDKNGLQIIEESGMENSILVTSYYANPQIRDKANQLEIKILPKQMASVVPIEIDRDLKDIDIVFVDDEECLLSSFRFLTSGKKVDTYSDPAVFLNNIGQYRKTTKFMLDQNFANYDGKGIEIAEQLHAMGFQKLYLLSGALFSSSDIPPFLTFLYKSDIDKLIAVLDEQ